MRERAFQRPFSKNSYPNTLPQPAPPATATARSILSNANFFSVADNPDVLLPHAFLRQLHSKLCMTCPIWTIAFNLEPLKFAPEPTNVALAFRPTYILQRLYKTLTTVMHSVVCLLDTKAGINEIRLKTIPQGWVTLMVPNNFFSFRIVTRPPLSLDGFTLLQPCHNDFQTQLWFKETPHLAISKSLSTIFFHRFIREVFLLEQKVVPRRSFAVTLLAFWHSSAAGTTNLSSSAHSKVNGVNISTTTSQPQPSGPRKWLLYFHNLQHKDLWLQPNQDSC